MKPKSNLDQYKYVSMQIETLKYSGIWCFIPYTTNSFKFWVGFFYRLFIGIVIFIIPSLGQVIYLIRLIANNAEIQEVCAVINLVLTEMLTSIKLLDLCLRRHFLTQLLEQINNEEFNLLPRTNLDVLEKSIKFSRRLFVYMVVTSSSVIFVHVIVIPALNGFRTLPLDMDFILFDVNDYFLCINAYQVLYKPMMIVAFATLMSLPWSFMTCAIGQLDVLIYNFENMKELVKATKSETNCGENEAFESIFKKCLRHHCAIKRFVNTLEATFGGQFSLTLAFSACIICTTAVQLFSIESLRDNIAALFWIFPYFIDFIIFLFIDCYLGEFVTMKSGRISTAVYSCPWVDLTPKLSRSLVTVIGETQRPLVIRAMNKLVPVSLETFTTVMNWTYKGFALMNQTKD
ncbi:odorant receptor 46a-like [Epargyreus clarus]|uniref:odorant receptor 46a-like n=1 Tax=Epargyreus clarus TaxID=520877 RepID=UPI003C2ACEC6